MSETTNPFLIRIEDLKVHFRTTTTNWFSPASVVHAVDGISFNIKRGTTFGIVGESGSGKSTAALALLRLVPITSGRIYLEDDLLSEASGEDLRRLRRKVQIIFQDP